MNSELSFEEKQERLRRSGWWRNFIRERGERYADCRLTNYEIHYPEQERQIAYLDTYFSRMESNLADGIGATFFGPCGTGKDHLAVAICRTGTLRYGKRSRWIDGMSLFGDLRNSFDGSGQSESEIIGSLRRVPLLAISDPLPVSGELTSYQASVLFRVIDGRYSSMLPTIITVNLAKGEAENRLGPAILDRLKDSSLLIHCNWPSHRGKPERLSLHK